MPLQMIVGKAAAKFAKRKIQAGLSNETKQQLSGLSNEIFGYDFVNLFMKMLVFYTIALMIEKFHNIVNGASSFWGDVLGFFGVNVPNKEPDFLTKLFSTDGVNGLKYWQLINALVLGKAD
jgi:hypothetical protein